MRIKILVLVFIFLGSVSLRANPVEVKSPDGKTKVVIDSDTQVTYSVFRNDKPVLVKSTLQLTVGGEKWGRSGKPMRTRQETIKEKVDFLVSRKYKTLDVTYKVVVLQYKNYNIEFRVYNDGVAYRFVSTKSVNKPVESEVVNFAFSDNHKTYTLLTNKLQSWYEEDYTIKSIQHLPKDSFSLTPVMVEAGPTKVLLAESNVFHYAGMHLQASGNSFNGVFANYPKTEEYVENNNKRYVTERHPYIIPVAGLRSFPWRVIGLFDNDIDIVSSELIYLLAEPQSTEFDFSFVKGGRVLWDWWNDRNIYHVNFSSGINTDTYLYLIDYASEHGIEYILIDEGWSLPDDLMKLNPAVDIPKICAYADSKKVGVQLWAKWVNVDRQMDQAFPQFEKWNVKGVKVDFMDRNDAAMVDFYERVTRTAAKHKLLVDFHGSYPGDGMSRKYPNLMTREGVLGLEYNKWSKRATVRHDVIIPYLRMWFGAMDYTPGAMLNDHAANFVANHHEPMSQGTRSHQLAMYVVYESPLQMISDSPTKYDENPESFDFIKQIPAVWDETVPLSGKIGEYIAVARRRGNVWYVGAMNGTQPHELELDLSFLGNQKKIVKVHKDGVNANQQAKDYKVEEIVLGSTNKLTVNLASGGGYVAIINVQKTD